MKIYLIALFMLLASCAADDKRVYFDSSYFDCYGAPRVCYERK